MGARRSPVRRAVSLLCGLAALLAACGAPAPRPAGPPASAPAPGLALRFVLDRDFDRARIWGMSRVADPAGWEHRSRSMGLEPSVAARIKAAREPAEVADLLNRVVEARYRWFGARLPALRDEYEREWARLVRRFSDVVTELTGRPWYYRDYVVVVSAFHRGISNWYGNLVACDAAFSLEFKRRMVAYEVTLSHVFHVVRSRHAPAAVDDWRVWAFAEVTTVLLLADARLAPEWPSAPRPGTYFAGSGYPQLAPLEAELLRLFAARRSFEDYVDRAVPVLRRFSQTHRPAATRPAP
jgi:hypothetical protein